MADKTGEGLERVDSIRQKAEGMKADAAASQVSAADMVALSAHPCGCAVVQIYSLTFGSMIITFLPKFISLPDIF